MPKVIIVGCGIAGPVLALLLKQKGFEPVIYERGERGPSAGLSLMLQPNGLQVLSSIPGLVDRIPGKAVDYIKLASIIPGDERVLGEYDSPATLRRNGSFGMIGVNRPKLLAFLADVMEEQGIPVHFNTPVVGVEQSQDEATVKLGNGDTDSAPLVVGCDGMHSAVRKALFGEEQPVFTGLTQTGGVTPHPFPDSPPAMINFYGDGMHVIAYPISDSHYSWALTERGPEAKETWRAMDQASQDAFKAGPFSVLPSGVGGLVGGAEKIIKYGLYDRPELAKWHQGRVLLIGDAAHPTSPHLGQGANQAFEDTSLLSKLLDGTDLSLDSLTNIFTTFEAARIPKTAVLAKGARQAGEMRVVSGLEAAKQRNDVVAKEWMDRIRTASGSKSG
uniref:FAD/NAD(P)-binding domain-containing protein n=1 Tax=Mycena chlorophos TaxID=658473 RepID=A0ABQ0LI12_MYCCL|nr:FAD/NAD(P)-binding domain-containing protein [Mycena chlorophos]